MNDTLSIKALAINTVGATQLPGTALSFPRVASTTSGTHLRQNTAIGSLSPTVLRVAHQPRTTKSPVQRSLIAIDQTLTRVDALSNPIGEDKITFASQCNISKGVTKAEFRAAAAIHFGAMLATDGELLDAMYNQEF